MTMLENISLRGQTTITRYTVCRSLTYMQNLDVKVYTAIDVLKIEDSNTLAAERYLSFFLFFCGWGWGGGGGSVIKINICHKSQDLLSIIIFATYITFHLFQFFGVVNYKSGSEIQKMYFRELLLSLNMKAQGVEVLHGRNCIVDLFIHLYVV